MSQLFEWSLAGLPLACDPADRPASGWWLETYADGFDLGSAEGVSAVRASLLLDGDDERIEHWGNRSMSWTTAVCGRTFADIADGERALASVVGGAADLVFTPPGDGFSTLFEVRTSSMRPVVNDLDWISAGVKYQAYQLTVKAAPWGLSTSAQSETFAPGAGTITELQDGSSATNWPGMSTGTYLSQTAVKLGPIPAPSTGGLQQAHILTSVGSIGAATWGINGVIRYTATIPAATYMYMDIAFETTVTSFFGAPVPFLRMAATPFG